jgi:hypothetical protein
MDDYVENDIASDFTDWDDFFGETEMRNRRLIKKKALEIELFYYFIHNIFRFCYL